MERALNDFVLAILNYCEEKKYSFTDVDIGVSALLDYDYSFKFECGAIHILIEYIRGLMRNIDRNPAFIERDGGIYLHDNKLDGEKAQHPLDTYLFRKDGEWYCHY